MPTVATQGFPGLIPALAWLGLLHAAWTGLMIAACVAWLFQARGTTSHRARLGVLRLSLGLVAVAPAVFVAMQVAATAEPSEATPPGRAISFVARSGSNPERHRDSPAFVHHREDVADPSTPALDLLEALLVRAAIRIWASQVYGLAIWGLACLVGLVTLAFGLEGMRRLRRDSVAADGRVIARVEQLAGGLLLRRVPAVLVHPTLDQPCLCGVFRSAIVLPGPWLSTAAPETLDAVLAHELAHAKRLDPLWNILQRLLETAWFFHPGVRWLSRSLRREREIAADSLAVRTTGDPLALARALESVARLSVHRLPRHGGAAFGGEAPALLPRIQELLGMTPTRPRFRAWPFAAFTAAVVLALVTASVGLLLDVNASTRRPLAASDESLDCTISGGPLNGSEDDSRQIAFEFRFVQTEPDAWREAMNGALKPLPNPGKVGRWIIDGRPSFVQLMTSVMAQPTSTMTCAPKPTTFEIHPLVMTTSAKIDGRIRERATIKIVGTILTAGIRMTMDLTESMSLSPGPGPEMPGETSERRLAESFEIPDDSSLVLSLGRHTRLVENREVPSERLIVITPRRITLEAEEGPIGRDGTFTFFGNPEEAIRRTLKASRSGATTPSGAPHLP